MTYGKIFVLAAVVAATGCDRNGAADRGVPQQGSAGGTEQAAGTRPTLPGTATVAVRTQEPYGSYLVDAQGRALYLFTADAQGQQSTCYDQCAEAWPPLLSDGEPQASENAEQAMLGTIERRDGRLHVTYNGWPLYLYVRDKGPGQVSGQDIESFGGEWYLISPQGQKIEAEEEPPRARL